MRNTLNGGKFIEVFVDARLEVCEPCDPKGLYKKAHASEIKGFTDIDDPYEEPLSLELVLQAAEETPGILVAEIITYLRDNSIIG